MFITLVVSLQSIFSVCALNAEEWWTVLKISFPVVIIDETFKYFSRKMAGGSKEKMDSLYLISAWVTYAAIVYRV